MMRLGLEQLQDHMRSATKVRQVGRVLQVVGTIIEAELPGVAVGACSSTVPSSWCTWSDNAA